LHPECCCALMVTPGGAETSARKGQGVCGLKIYCPVRIDSRNGREIGVRRRSINSYCCRPPEDPGGNLRVLKPARSDRGQFPFGIPARGPPRQKGVQGRRCSEW